MATTYSAGLLPFRFGQDGAVELLIVHPGGPFWSRKDDGAWSIPKGEYDPGREDPLAAAEREFAEEIGQRPGDGPRIPLGELRQPSGKRVSAWALEGDLDVREIESNRFEMEWPPRSGRRRSFPEVDRAMWCPAATARVKLVRGQVGFVDRLLERLSARGAPPAEAQTSVESARGAREPGA